MGPIRKTDRWFSGLNLSDMIYLTIVFRLRNWYLSPNLAYDLGKSLQVLFFIWPSFSLLAHSSVVHFEPSLLAIEKVLRPF